MHSGKILVVDDDWKMRNLVRIYLKKDGYEVTEAASGDEALQLLSEQAFHLILLDIMMPGMDGWILCRRIREHSHVPILMLTARTDMKDKVYGLELGADDYLVKPFEAEELLARVFALIRRSHYAYVPEEDISLRFSQMIITPEAREVRIQGVLLELTPKEFDLMLLLAKQPQRVFTREIIVGQLWNYDFAGDVRSVDSHVKNIRDKVNKAGLAYNPIQTIWGVGYRFYHPGVTT